MQQDEMLTEYLQRIAYPNPDELTSHPISSETLRQLHRCHCTAIPFENLTLVHPDLKTGNPPPVALDDIHKKLVQHKRGGSCMQQNRLLCGMLRKLGCTAYEGFASVVTPDSLQPPRQPLQGLPTSQAPGATQELEGLHMVVFVRFDNGDVYLADAGFGGQGLLEPVLVRAYDDGGSESHQAGTRYRIRRGVAGSAELLPAEAVDSHPDREAYIGWYLQAFMKDTWVDLYFFRLEARTAPEFNAFSFFNAHTHPLFTRSIVVTKPLEDGRATLVDMTYKVRRAGQPTQVVKFESEQDRDELIKSEFGIDLTAKI